MELGGDDGGMQFGAFGLSERFRGDLGRRGADSGGSWEREWMDGRDLLEYGEEFTWVGLGGLAITVGKLDERPAELEGASMLVSMAA